MRTVSCWLVVAALVVNGCDDMQTPAPAGASEEIGVESARPSGTDSTDPFDAILAEFKVGEAAGIRFVDEAVSIPNGGVGVLIYGAHVRSEEKDLTPLELYLALAPESEIPARLVENHQEIVRAERRASFEPRDLYGYVDVWDPRLGDLAAAPTGPIFLQEEGSSDGCTAWLLDEWIPFIDEEHPACDETDSHAPIHGNADFTTGLRSQRCLGGCNERGSIDWLVQAQLSGSIWTDVSGTATTLTLTASLTTDWVQYYSSSGFSSVNYRIHYYNANNPRAAAQLAW
jgi:hypothetical protein